MTDRDVPPVEPDAKDWTWVLERPCPACGYDASTVELSDVGRLIRENAAAFERVLTAPGAADRPEPTTWSAQEYGCHVRDVHRLFRARLALMLESDDPVFENWDQDATAVADDYHRQDPAAVAAELVAAADVVAAVYDGVPDDAWHRPGRRDNGSAFTVGSLARYHLHDAVHHAADVGA